MKRGSLWIAIVMGIGPGLSPIGCTNNSGEAVETPHPTLVEVDPDVFLKNVPCGTEPGMLQSYVATLFDMTALGTGNASDGPSFIELPSSGPVPCNRSVAFTFVVPTHAYAARIQGYTRSPAELEQPEPGVPVLVVPGTKTTISPDWTAECGQPPGSTAADSGTPPTRVVSQFQETRIVSPCEPLVRHGRETPTSVVVGLDATSCEELDVESFTVRQNGQTVASASCGETVELGTPDVQAGEFVELELLAFGADASTPKLGTLCTAKVLEGVRVGASCDPLAGKGSIRINVADVLSSMGLTCSDPLDVVLTLSDAAVAPVQLGRESCRGIARFSDLAPGEYDVRAESALVTQSASCRAAVEPGLSAVAACSANP